MHTSYPAVCQLDSLVHWQNEIKKILCALGVQLRFLGLTLYDINLSKYLYIYIYPCLSIYLYTYKTLITLFVCLVVCLFVRLRPCVRILDTEWLL